MSPFLIPFGAWLAAGPGFTLSGDASCPRPDEIAVLLATMSPPDGAAAADGDRAEVVIRGVETTVRLADASGAIVGESVLEGSCEERAHRAAALLATWRTRLVVESRIAIAHPRAPASPPTAAAVATVPASEPKDGRRGSFATRLGAAVLASADNAGLAPTGMLEIQAQPWVGRAWGRLAVEDTGEKSLSLGQGGVKWTRFALQAGAVTELGAGTGRLGTSLRGDFLVSRVSVHGDGFTTNRQATIWQVGADLGLRFHLSLSPRAGVWVDLSAVAWPGQQVLSAGNVTNTQSLPTFEGRLGLGGTFPLMP